MWNRHFLFTVILSYDCASGSLIKLIWEGTLIHSSLYTVLMTLSLTFLAWKLNASCISVDKIAEELVWCLPRHKDTNWGSYKNINTEPLKVWYGGARNKIRIPKWDNIYNKKEDLKDVILTRGMKSALLWWKRGEGELRMMDEVGWRNAGCVH